jgi:hypothetical protein
MAVTEWKPALPLKHFFKPTRLDRVAEIRKAKIKNHNLPILQYMYNGDPLEPLKCMITQREGWVDFPCLLTKSKKQRFNIDFNHIRQRQQGKSVPGNSIDKCAYVPSGVFRCKYLDKSPEMLIEFMCIMPVSQEVHNYITQDSALGHITLDHFAKKYWPWVLQNKKNFNAFCKKYDLIGLDYEFLIDHLSDIKYPSIHERIVVN